LKFGGIGASARRYIEPMAVSEHGKSGRGLIG